MENVRGHLTLGFKEVLKGLAEIGYDAKWRIVRASDVGAPHQRARLFIIAEPSNADSQRTHLGELQPTQGSQGESQSKPCQCCTAITNADSLGQQIQIAGQFTSQQESASNGNNGIVGNPNDKCISHNWSMSQLGRRFATRCEMRLQRTPNPLDLEGRLNAVFVEYMMGLPEGWVTDLGFSRAQQLKMLGNGVVPQQAEYAIHQLLNQETPS
jgi:DNA (cytosine-5)-methyltransferase 1